MKATFDSNYSNNLVFTGNGISRSIHNYEWEIKRHFQRGDSFDDFYLSLREDFVMLPVFIFGCKDLYIPIRGDIYAKKVIRELNTEEAKEWIKTHTNPYKNFDNDKVKALIMSRKPKDSPMMLDVNTHIWLVNNFILDQDYLCRDSLNVLIPIYILTKLTEELNQLQAKEIDCQAADETIFSIYELPWTEEELYNYDCLEDLIMDKTKKNITLNIEGFTPYNLSSIEDMIYKVPNPDVNRPIIPNPLRSDYIIPETARDRRYYLTNNPSIEFSDIDSQSNIFVRVKDLPLYQKMSVKAFKLLRSLTQVTVSFSKEDDPYMSTKVYYVNHFAANNIQEIVKLSILLCVDIDLSNTAKKSGIVQEKLLKDGIDYTNDDSELHKKYIDYITWEDSKIPMYDSITIGVTQMGVHAHATLSQKELGIEPFDKSFQRYNNDFRYANRQRNNFCLLNLITEIASLQLSMGRERVYDFDSKYREIDFYGR